MIRVLYDYLIIILSILGSIATLVGFYHTYYQTIDDHGKWGVIFLGIIAIWFLLVNLYLIAKHRNKLGYAKSFEDLNIAFTHLHKLDRKENLVAEDITTELKHVCTHVSNSFSTVKGEHINVCIKVMAAGNNENAEVITLCRDGKSSQKRPVDKENVVHRLSENCDFNYIYEHAGQGICHYLNNRLPFSYDYTNTRLKQFPKWPPTHIPFIDTLLRYYCWPLEYKSTLVLPIVPLNVNERTKDAIRGFLCIDSSSLNTFNTQSDLEILKGVSDGLYNKIDKLQKIL